MTKIKETEWFGELPQGWEAKRIKYLPNDQIDAFVDGDWIDSIYIENEGIRYLTTGNIGNGKFKEQGDGYISSKTFNKLKCKYAYPGDLVFSRLNTPYGRSCFLPSTYDKYVLAVDNVIFRTNEDKKYICYLTQTEQYQDATAEKARGTTMKRISRFNLGNIKIPVPPIDTQHRIADYLDDKTAILDEKISAAKSQIENLKAYRAALIHDVVCHGVPGTHDNSDYVNSGIQWIGEVPREWEITKGKYLFTERSTRGNDTLVLLSPTQKYGVIPQSELEGAVRVKDDDVLPTFKTVHKGDFIISLRSFQGGFEYSELEGVCSPAYHTFIPIVCIHDGYYRYLFKSTGFIDEMASHCMSLRDGQNIPFEWVKNTCLPVPPISEQQMIAEYLDNKTKLADDAIHALETAVQDLDDYKKALIYEVVTGKKTV